MRTLDIFAVCCFVVYAVSFRYVESTNHTKRGFILTAPKAIDAGCLEYFTFTAFDVPPNGQLTLQLLHWYTDELLAETKVTVLNNMNMWVEMNIPPRSSDLRARLKVHGSFSDGYLIDAEKEVLIRHNSVLTFVQTDKPIYKPGQTVRFRILPMDSQLKPMPEETVADVRIEDPTGIRVAQWKNVNFTQGIVQLELPLSSEPPFGTWSIKSIINQVSNTQKFKVEKYVLPKFDVKVNPPAYVMADADFLSVEVCAWYTYGKQVDGTLKISVSYKKYEWDRRLVPSVEHSGLISGCTTINFNSQDILLQSREFAFRVIEIFAEVTENGTEIRGNASASVGISHSALKLKFFSTEEKVDYFKPGLPFYGKLSVEKPDGVPAASEKIDICVRYLQHTQETDDMIPTSYFSEFGEKICQMFTSNKKGLISFSIPPKPSIVHKIALEAVAVNYHAKAYPSDSWVKQIKVPRAELILQPWFSPSDNYLQIQPILGEMECEKLQRVKVRYTAEKGTSIKFYHQVLSRGRIVQQGSHQRSFYAKKEETPVLYDLGETLESEWSGNGTTGPPDIGEFLLSFDPRPTMAPIARLLVFYVRPDGEVVADARMFRISQCLLNKVSLHFRHEQQYPSTESTLLLTASPSSVCGITMVDKSVSLLNSEKQFKKQNIFKAMEDYDVGKGDRPFQVSEDYCLLHMNNRNHDQPEARIIGDRPNSYPSQPYLSRLQAIHADTSMAFEEAGMVVISNFELETRPCVKRTPIAVPRHYNLELLDDFDEEERSVSPQNLRPRMPLLMTGLRPSPSPELKKEDTEKPVETEEIRSYFPETWLWEMHTVGLSGETALQRKLPHTITQWVGGAVCVHPKTGLGIFEGSSITAFQPFFLSFQLPYSVIRGEVLPLVVSVFNYLSECLPIKLSLEPSEEFETLSESRFGTLCVCGGQKESYRYLIRPLSLGQVNITVYGFSLEDDDALCGNEVTARLGARDALSKQLLVEAEGFPKEEVFNFFVCPENTNGSYATEVDLLLPEDVIDGSARAFLSVTGDLMGPALNGLKSLVRLPVGCGEQNMVLFTPNIFVLDYLAATGAITSEIKEDCLNNMKIGYQRELQYRHKDGSYSAFGSSDPEGSLWLTAFVVRSFGQARRFVTIDEQDLSLSTSWLLEKQFENGCFEPSGSLFSNAIKGGLGDNEQSLAPLTAYVLISLLESGVQRPEQPAVQAALRCLSTEDNPSSYALALFAYANALAMEPGAANRYLRYLDDRATVKSSHKFWSPTSQEGGSKSVSVEIAGYYILARMQVGGRASTANVQPIVRWIIHQRNSNGGFVSTQDTVVALQAISTYSALQSQTPLDMGLAIENDQIVKGFKLEEHNKLVTQTVKVPVLPTILEVQAVGDGCAIMQFSLRYNVEKVTGSEAFDLNIEAVRRGSSKCNLPTLGICMRYRIPDQKSNMVVVEVRMASGFVPDEWSLYKLQSDEKVQLKRHEVDGNQVNLYFNELTNEQKCFMFHIKSETEVEDIKPSSIKLYDYYQPELEITKEYTIPSLCLHADVPELPWLPPILIDTEDDDTTTVPFEDDSLTQETTLAEDPQQSTIDSDPLSTEVTELSFTESSTIEDATTDLSSDSTTESSTIAEVTEQSLVQLEMSDDATLYRGNDTHLDNFVDVDHELDFPDGVDGNVPVSVLPLITEEAVLECPICEETFPGNFTEIYCSSAFAVRVMIREVNSGTVKIMQDLSWFLPQPKTIKKFAKLDYNHECVCPQLHEKGTILILGSPVDLWNYTTEKHSIHLTNTVYVIASPSKTVQPLQVKQARSLCSDDP